MSVTPEPGPLGPRITLFAHALRLHQQHRDGVLPRGGKPYPDDGSCRSRPLPGTVRQRHGADVAALLDGHFGRPDAEDADLAEALRDVYVPIHRNDHIAAAALRADRERVRRTGRWLVRHGTHRNAVAVGLALLATDPAGEHIPLIQTIGLLSDTFGALAAEALQRRHGGDEALMWLAERVSGWGRVYAVEALCRHHSRTSRAWLLRHACDGDYLDRYFVGRVATAAHLHAAITAGEVDDELVDHTGRLLQTMSVSDGMGMTLDDYPPAPAVLAAHAAHLARQTPTAERYTTAALIVDRLTAELPHRSACTADQRDRIARQYLAVLDQPAWCAAVRASPEPAGDYFAWFTGHVAARLHLRAFTDRSDGDVVSPVGLTAT